VNLRNPVSLILITIVMSVSLLSCADNQSRISEFNNYSARVNVNIADLKAKPERRSERVTQALYNEIVEVIDTVGRFALIRQSDSYTGWIRKYYLDDNIGISGDGPYIVDVFLTPATDIPAQDAIRVTMFPNGCFLYGSIIGAYLKIESSRYGVVFVNLEDILHEEDYYITIRPDSVSVSKVANKFMGAPYLWGGKSFYGIDCSGLTQMVLSKFGVDILRDSKDQKTQGIEIQRADIRAGDLLFFPKHVGIAVSNDMMIHSTGQNGGVAYSSLDPESPIYSKYHDELFETARRVIE